MSFPARCLWKTFPVFAILTSGCMLEPITGRTVLQLVPEDELNEMGTLSYQQILEQETVSNDPEKNAMLQRVGARIAAVADRYMREADPPREPYDWQFTVIESPQANAFALPGGKVAFYTGIFPICRDDTGIAVVMGHEIAHAYLMHGGKRVSESMLANMSMQSILLALGGEQASDTAQLAMAALGVGYQFGVALPFSRSDESAADQAGLRLMAEAGYDPSEAAEFWKRMAQASGGNAPPEFLSTHPASETRVRQLEEWLPEAMEVYRRNRQ